MLLELGDYLDTENEKKRLSKYGAQVSGLGNLMDSNGIEKMVNSDWGIL